METLSGRSSISTAVIRWTWKTHGREDMHFFLTQLLWLHRHSLLCPLPLTCMWTHCGQKMITDWLPWLASIPCAWWHVDYCGCEVAMWTQIIVHVPKYCNLHQWNAKYVPQPSTNVIVGDRYKVILEYTRGNCKVEGNVVEYSYQSST